MFNSTLILFLGESFYVGVLYCCHGFDHSFPNRTCKNVCKSVRNIKLELFFSSSSSFVKSCMNIKFVRFYFSNCCLN